MAKRSLSTKYYGQNIALEGLDQLEMKLKRLAGVIDDEALENRMLSGAELVRDDAVRMAPLGPTGNLKRGIIAKKFDRKIPGHPSAFVAIDYRIAPHAHLVEFGARGGQMPAKPFFRPAIDANRENVKTIIKNGTWEVIEDEVRQ